MRKRSGGFHLLFDLISQEARNHGRHGTLNSCSSSSSASVQQPTTENIVVSTIVGLRGGSSTSISTSGGAVRSSHGNRRLRSRRRWLPQHYGRRRRTSSSSSVALLLRLLLLPFHSHSICSFPKLYDLRVLQNCFRKLRRSLARSLVDDQRTSRREALPRGKKGHESESEREREERQCENSFRVLW